MEVSKVTAPTIGENTAYIVAAEGAVVYRIHNHSQPVME